MVSSASSITARNWGSSTVSHMARRRRSPRVAPRCRMACSNRPCTRVPHAWPASARCDGVSATTTFDGSSDEASTERVIRPMCRASAVTDVTDHEGRLTRACAFSRDSIAAVCDAVEQSRAPTARELTAAGTDNWGACFRKLSSTPHARLVAVPTHRLTTTNCRPRVAATYKSRSSSACKYGTSAASWAHQSACSPSTVSA